MHPQSPAGSGGVPSRYTTLPGVDRRRAGARRFRQLVEMLAAEIGAPLTAADWVQVRAAASLSLHTEDLTARAVNGEVVNSEELTRAANGAIRAAAAVKARRGRPAKGDGFRALQASLAAKREAAA